MSQVIVTQGSSVGPTPAQFNSLQDQVALILGRQLDEESLRRCGQFINRVIKELNTRPWKALLTTGTNISVVAGTRDYSLDSLFYKESKVQRLDDNSKPVYTLQYMDWEAFQSLLHQQADQAAPMMYSLRNTHTDGIISIYPIPDKDYTLTVQYYARISLLTNADDSLTVPIEFENYIINKAQYYLLDLFHHERTAEKKAACEEDMARLIRADEIHSDNNARIRLPQPKVAFGTLYIKA